MFLQKKTTCSGCCVVYARFKFFVVFNMKVCGIKISFVCISGTQRILLRRCDEPGLLYFVTKNTCVNLMQLKTRVVCCHQEIFIFFGKFQFM